MTEKQLAMPICSTKFAEATETKEGLVLMTHTQRIVSLAVAHPNCALQIDLTIFLLCRLD